MGDKGIFAPRTKRKVLFDGQELYESYLAVVDLRMMSRKMRGWQLAAFVGWALAIVGWGLWVTS